MSYSVSNRQSQGITWTLFSRNLEESQQISASQVQWLLRMLRQEDSKCGASLDYLKICVLKNEEKMD